MAAMQELMRRRIRQRGITLMEVIMVMLVAAVLLGLGLPLASALVGRLKAGGARDAFVNTYARARAAAVQYGREGRLQIRAERGEFWVEVDTGRADLLGTDTIGQVVNVRNDYGGVTMFSPRRLLCFDSRGLTYAGGGCEPHDAIIVFTRSSRADTIQLSLGGTVVKRR